MEELQEFRVPVEGLHTETGPGVFEAAILYAAGVESGDRGVLFKQSVKDIGQRFGIMPSFMAKWSTQYPGWQRARAPEPVGRQAQPFLRRAPSPPHVQAVRELSRRGSSRCWRTSSAFTRRR